MGEVVQFTRKVAAVGQTVSNEDSYVLDGKTVQRPRSGYEYKELLREFLDEEDYRDVLAGIVCEHVYETLEPELKNIVHSYYELNASNG